MRLVARFCQPSTLRILIWPEASNAQNSIAAVSADGSTVCVLILRLNSSCSRSIALVVRALRHWLGGRRAKVNSRSPASSRLPSPAALDEIVGEGGAGLGGLAAHALDREQHLLAVLAYAKDDKERDGSRFAVEPHAHHCAVENEPHD